MYSYRRGVLVARSDELGYPRASVVERVTGKILHAFFVYSRYFFLYCQNLENRKAKNTLIIMKTFFVLISFVFCGIMSSHAQTNSVVKKTASETMTSAGISYYGFDGFDNWGIAIQSIKPNGVSGELALRTNFDDHGNYNLDLGINYSFALLTSGDVKLYLTAAAGPSLRLQDEYKGTETVVTQHNSLALGKYTTSYDKENWDSNNFYVDCYLNARATLAYKSIAISGGYYYWAPKFKFGKKYKADGFMATVGFFF